MVDRVHTSGLLFGRAFDDLSYGGRFYDRKGREIHGGDAFYLKHMHPTYDRVGDTYLGPEAYPTTRVSTVWLGEPQHTYPRPQFETMVFSDIEELDTLDVRYWTWREAEIGHRKVVRIIKALVCTKVPVVKRHKSRNRR